MPNSKHEIPNVTSSRHYSYIRIDSPAIIIYPSKKINFDISPIVYNFRDIRKYNTWQTLLLRPNWKYALLTLVKDCTNFTVVISIASKIFYRIVLFAIIDLWHHLIFQVLHLVSNDALIVNVPGRFFSTCSAPAVDLLVSV